MLLRGDEITNWQPGMAVTLGGATLRVVRVYEGDYLGGSYIELLVVEENEHATPTWVLPRYVSVVVDECPTDPRTLGSSVSLTSPSRQPSSPSFNSSSPSSCSPATLDTQAIRSRLRESMTAHPMDAALHLLTHAERDILDLCAEVDALRETHEVRRP